MRVIFLDVDGVLNSNSFAEKMFSEQGVRVFYEDILDKRAIACLKQIVSATGATIVLSSSWRKIPKRWYKELVQARSAAYFLLGIFFQKQR